MVDRSDPKPSPPPARPTPTVLDVFEVAVPSSRIDSPDLHGHVIDMHLGAPVQASCRIDGRERNALLTHGQFTVLPTAMTSHWLLARPAHALILDMRPSLLAETADAMGLRTSSAELVPAIHARDPQIERLARILQVEAADAFPAGRLFVDSLASALAARLLALQAPTQPSAPRLQRVLPPRRLRLVLEYIEAHLDEELTLAELAGVAGYSVSHFKLLFKAAMGAAVHRYVLERRVERARMLLLEGTRSNTEIALEAGFAHPSHMARCMRRILGLTPSQIAAADD